MRYHVLALSVCVLSACRGGDPEDSGGPADVDPIEPGALQFEGPAPRNIVLLVVDTLRRDRVSLYPGSVDSMPRLAALQDHLVVVEDLQSASSWTGASTASILTSLDPLDHRVWYLSGAGSAVPDDVVTWAEQIRASGYVTGQFSANPHASEAHRLSAGFTTSVTQTDARGVEFVPQFFGWVDGLDGAQPFFAHVQLMDPHQNYNPLPHYTGTLGSGAEVPVADEAQRDFIHALDEIDAEDAEEAVGELRALYSEDVLGADEAIEVLIEGLEARGLADDTLVVFLADHGESLGEREWIFGHRTAASPIQDLPLAFFNPRLAPGRLPGLWSQVDVIPTALAAVGAEVAPVGDGLDLNARTRDEAILIAIRTNLDFEMEATSFSITTPTARVSFDCGGAIEAFDRVADPTSSTPLELDGVPGAAELAASLVDQVKSRAEAGHIACVYPRL